MKYNAEGLMPAIIQQYDTNEILMLAWMNKESINYYFKYIQKSLVKNGYFLCINRYYKDTVGYPIELHNYPFDKNWSVIISEASWFQDHVHFFF